MRRSWALVLVAVCGSLAAGCVGPDAEPGPSGGSNASGGTGPGPGLGLERSWSKSFGYSAMLGKQITRDIAITPSGDVAMALEFEYQVDIDDMPHPGAGTRDILVGTYKGDGTALGWAKVAADASEQLRPVVAVHTDGSLLVAGSFEGTIGLGGDPITSLGALDVFVGKLDASGAPLWLHSYGDPNTQYASDIAVDSQGNVIVVGFVSGEIVFGTDPPFPKDPNDAIFVAKFDPSGAPIWSRRLGRAGSSNWEDPPATVAVTTNDEIVIAGHSGGTLSIPGLNDIGLIGDRSAFVAKLDASGNGVWGKSFGAQDQGQRVYGVAVGPAGKVAITGELNGSVNFGGGPLVNTGGRDVFVAVFEANGDHLWSRRFGSQGDQAGVDLGFNRDGELFVAGSFSGALELYGENAVLNAGVGNSSKDVFLVKFDAEGVPLGGRAFGSDDWQYPNALEVDPSGNVFMAGHYNGTIDFGGEEHASTSAEDAFLVKFSPSAPP